MLFGEAHHAGERPWLVVPPRRIRQLLTAALIQIAQPQSLSSAIGVPSGLEVMSGREPAGPDRLCRNSIRQLSSLCAFAHFSPANKVVCCRPPSRFVSSHAVRSSPGSLSNNRDRCDGAATFTRKFAGRLSWRSSQLLRPGDRWKGSVSMAIGADRIFGCTGENCSRLLLDSVRFSRNGRATWTGFLWVLTDSEGDSVFRRFDSRANGETIQKNQSVDSLFAHASSNLNRSSLNRG